MGMMLEDMAGEAASLLDQAGALEARQDALGLPMPGGEQSGGQSPQPGSPGQSPSVSDSMGSMAGQMSQLSQQLGAQAGTAAQAAQPQAGGTPLDPGALGESFEQSTAAAGTPSPGEAASAAQQAASALQSLAQSAAQQLGMPAAPGMMPGMSPGMTPGQMPGPPSSQPSMMPGVGEGMGRQSIEVADGLPAMLKEMGMSKAEWTRLTGSLKGDVVDAGGDDIPAEYRKIIKRYFRQLAKHGGEQESNGKR